VDVKTNSNKYEKEKIKLTTNVFSLYYSRNSQRRKYNKNNPKGHKVH